MINRITHVIYLFILVATVFQSCKNNQSTKVETISYQYEMDNPSFG